MCNLNYLNHLKQASRKAGYYELDPVKYDHDQLQNGHVVEVAICHLLGIYQRYVKDIYKFNIVITSDLDRYGCDILIDTYQGNKFVQLKHTACIGSRDFIPGTYVVPVKSSGSDIVLHLLKFYKISLPYIEDYEFMLDELNYVWKKYTAYMYK